jgi:hypothetical protein
MEAGRTLVPGRHGRLESISENDRFSGGIPDVGIPLCDHAHSKFFPTSSGKNVNKLAIIELKGVVWNDWGQPKRIGDTLCSLNMEPSFQKSLLAS